MEQGWYDLERMKKALESELIPVPNGLSREQLRQFFQGIAHQSNDGGSNCIEGDGQPSLAGLFNNLTALCQQKQRPHLTAESCAKPKRSSHG